MNKQNDAYATAEASTNAPARVGAIRPIFNSDSHSGTNVGIIVVR